MNRPITSCLTCRRRKVRCDRMTPCSACQKGRYSCTYQSSDSTRRSLSPPSTTTRAVRSRSTVDETAPEGLPVDDRKNTASESWIPGNSRSPHTAESAPVERNLKVDHGTLLFYEGRSRLVSPLHWASIKEVGKPGCAVNQSGNGQGPDLKDVVMDSRSPGLTTVGRQSYDGDSVHPIPYTVHPSPLLSMSLLLGSEINDSFIVSYYPETMTDCQFFLDIFIENVEPVIHLLHHPTLRQQFHAHISCLGFYTSPTIPEGLYKPDASRDFEPLAFAIFFSAVYSMDHTTVQTRFGTSKSALLRRFQNGLELSLEKQDLLSSPAIPVMQAFVLFLVS